MKDQVDQLAKEILSINFDNFKHKHWQHLMSEWERRTGNFLSQREYDRIRREYYHEKNSN